MELNQNKSKGLGDSIEKVLEFTGVKKIVNHVIAEDCGCSARKEMLNEIFPYKK